MKLGLYAAAAAAALTLGVAGSANADVTFAGDYVTMTLNASSGTFRSLKHDPTGHGNPGVNDYITPGTPHDGFSVNTAGGGFRGNDNASGGGSFSGGTLTDVSAGSGYDFAASWTGSDGAIQVTNYYFFNAGDERVNVTTTLTALTDLEDFAFARSVDPDPDVNTFGTYETNNQRGNNLFGVTDFVGSAGPRSGLTLGLLNLSGNLYAHNTAIDGSCCSNINPNNVLGGYSDGPFGDYGLNMAWLIGNMRAGSSATVKYAYVVGDNIDDAGGTPGIPEPATWAMMIMGFGAIGSVVRRRRLLAA